MLVDTHCHLDFNRFDQDRLEVIKRAKKAGLTRILNPGVNLQTSEAAVKLAEVYPEVYAAVGVHPNDSLSWNVSTLNGLRELTGHPNVVAIGEIGLDYYRERAPREVQRQVFWNQLTLAAEEGLPVVVHTRNRSAEDLQAIQDALELLSEWKKILPTESPEINKRPGVLHSFSSNIQSAWQAVGLNFWIGITGPVTFRKAETVRQVVSEIPMEHLLIETDAPFLTPHPYRGKRNEPAYVRFVVEKIAEVRDIDFAKVAQKTTDNAYRLFNW